jgi:hypothetical protein
MLPASRAPVGPRNSEDCTLRLVNPKLDPELRPSGHLGTQLGLGWFRQNECDRAMVEDPPTDLRKWRLALGPQGRSQDPKGKLGTVPSVCGPLNAERDGGDSVRTNPVRL